MNICPRWTEVDGGRRQAVHLMDGFRRRTIKNIKMWTEVDGWTDGRKFVRRGLLLTLLQINEPQSCYYKLLDSFREFWLTDIEQYMGMTFTIPRRSGCF